MLVGAGTVRAERYGPVRLTPEQSEYRRERWGGDTPPPIAVVTRSGTLPLDSRLFASGRKPIVATTRRTADAMGARLSAVADVLVGGEDTVDIPLLIATLRDRGLRRILCEGGPTLLDELIVHDLVDEMCLTLAPRMAGPQPGARGQGGRLDMPRRLTLEHVLSRDDYLYLRYGRGPK